MTPNVEAAKRLRVSAWPNVLHYDVKLGMTWATDGYVIVAWKTPFASAECDLRTVMKGTWPAPAHKWHTTLAELRDWAIGPACPHCGHAENKAPRDSEGKSPGSMPGVRNRVDRLLMQRALAVFAGDDAVTVAADDKLLWLVGDGFWTCIAQTLSEAVGDTFPGPSQEAP